MPPTRSPSGPLSAAVEIQLRGDQVYEGLLTMLDQDAPERGTRLPGELELARRFDVSRPVLRQALARLRAEGRIYSRKGSGHYVGERSQPVSASPSFGPLTSLPDINALLEFRLAIECECAARAAIQRASVHRQEIRSRRRQFERAIAAGAPAIDEDIAFHLAIAQATDNRFFAMTLAAISDHVRFGVRLVRSLSARPSGWRRFVASTRRSRRPSVRATPRPPARRCGLICLAVSTGCSGDEAPRGEPLAHWLTCERSDFSHRRPVTRQLLIVGGKRDSLHERLRKQHPIERVLVKRRQSVHVHCMLAVDLKFHVAMIEERSAQQPRLDLEVLPAEGILDRDLPEACRAEQQFVLRVFDQLACRGCELSGVTGRPKQYLAVEQDFHLRPENMAAIAR